MRSSRDCRIDPRFKDNAWLQERLREQEVHYRMLEFPEKFGLWECNLIVGEIYLG